MNWGIVAGDTDKTIYLRLRDATTALAKTGLVFNSPGAVCSYTLPGTTPTAITLATQTVTGAHSDGWFVEVDAVNAKGLYRLDLPDAAIASGSYTIISIEFDGTIEESLVIELLPYPVNVTQLAGSTQSLVDLKDFADEGYNPVTNAVTALAGHTAQTGDNYATLAAGIAGETRNTTLLTQLQALAAVIEHQRSAHTHQPIGDLFFVDPVNGDTHANGNRGGINDPYNSVQDCHDNAVIDSNHDVIFLLSGAAAGATTLTEAVTISKRYLFVRGPGRDFIWTRSTNGDTITITADGVELAGFQLNTAPVGTGNGVTVVGADFFKAHRLWVNDTQGHGVQLTNCDNAIINESHFHGTGQGGAGHGVVFDAATGQSGDNILVQHCHFHGVQGDCLRLNPTGTGTINDAVITMNHFINATGNGVDLTGANVNRASIYRNIFGVISGENINDNGTNTVVINNEAWATAVNQADVQSRLPSSLVNGRMDATIDEIGMEAGAIDAVMQQQITETYHVDGVAPTLAQALMGILQCVTEFAIVGTTITVKRLDGSTTAMTFTLDDSVNPTSRTRTT